MIALHSQEAVAASSIAASFILAGNAITQSYMTIPALLIDFPPAHSPAHFAAATHLGRQWPLCWTVGNTFFRPISTLSTIGYAYTSWGMAQSGKGDWRLLAVAALLGLMTIVHSAVKMQPLNDRLAALAYMSSGGKATVGFGKNDQSDAEALARKWARWNHVRLVIPIVCGALAISQVLA